MTVATRNQPMDLQAALGVFAEPAKHPQASWHEAAAVIEAALQRVAAELDELEARASRDSVDLLAKGAIAEAQALGADLGTKRTAATQLANAAKEGQRRMQTALDGDVVARNAVEYERAERIAGERLECLRRIVQNAQLLGEDYKRFEVLSDQLWGALPEKPTRPHEIDLHAPDAIEYGVGRFLYYASGWKLGETWSRVAGGILAVPDLVSVCERAHATLLAKSPRRGGGARLVVDEAEFERRTRAADQQATGGPR